MATSAPPCAWATGPASTTLREPLLAVEALYNLPPPPPPAPADGWPRWQRKQQQEHEQLPPSLTAGIAGTPRRIAAAPGAVWRRLQRFAVSVHMERFGMACAWLFLAMTAVQLVARGALLI